MTVITREIVNKEIMYYDYGNGSELKIHSHDDLCKRVDLFKNFLVERGCQRGESVLNGYGPSLDQTALFLAACELGLNFVVNDYKVLDSGFDFIDTKTKLLLPIHYYFDYSNIEENKRKFFTDICENYISIEEVNAYDNYTTNETILAEPTDILMRCTSSGTTGTPKIVKHTHEFLYNISKRNSNMFDGNVALLWNFNHGSSIATYFIPSLISVKVKKLVTAFVTEIFDNKNVYETIMNDVDHLMVPYSNQLESIIDKYELSNLTYYTLSPISDMMISLKHMFKDVVSFFGCNEISGPIFINRASFDNFKTNVYHKIDDYYDIKGISPLTVTLSEYSNDINTNDEFEFIGDNAFQFNGRKDILRINGVPIKDYRNTLNLSDSDFVYDTVFNKIYLACWSKLGDISKMNDKIMNLSNGAHRVSKAAILNRSDFILGVKLDQEFLRSYFREKVADNV